MARSSRRDARLVTWKLVAIGLMLGALLLAPATAALCQQASILFVAAAALIILLLEAIAALMVACAPPSRAWLRWVYLLVAVAAPMVACWLFGCADLSLRLVAHALAIEVLAGLLIAALLLAVVARFASTLLSGLHGNGYGICSGQTTDNSTHPVTGLTDWLTGYFDGLAALPAGRAPLTFGDLWGCTDPEAPRNINLEVMTTAVSQSMGYSIPFRRETPRFYYDPEEWSRYFPRAVMDWLDKADKACPEGDSKEKPSAVARVVNADMTPLRALPRRADVPVIVAVRMSLSFPLLLSAVPLYSIDWTLKASQKQKKQIDALEAAGDTKSRVDIEATRVWFSDGGISSNMPLHFFDSLLPLHPTFAINLKAEHPDYPIVEPENPSNAGGRIFLANNNRSGRLRYWKAPDDRTPIGGLVGFLSGIVNTMQNWRDELLFPYPGFRDRIVQISQRPDEGGLNLDMPKPVLDDLAGAGAMAAERLIDRFHPDGTELGAGWVNHQEVRLGTFLGTMQPAAAHLNSSLESGLWKTRSAGLNFKTAADRELCDEFLEKLEELSALGKGTKASLLSGALKPVAEIRISPRI